MAWSAMTNRTPARGRSSAMGGGEVRITGEAGQCPSREGTSVQDRRNKWWADLAQRGRHVR